MYTPDDYLQLCLWSVTRLTHVPPEWALPPNGVIVDGKAVGFLILMDNNCGMIDFFLSNPKTSKKERREALDQVSERLIDIARDRGVRMLLCSTRKKVIRDRALKYGFTADGHFMSFKKEL